MVPMYNKKLSKEKSDVWLWSTYYTNDGVHIANN